MPCVYLQRLFHTLSLGLLTQKKKLSQRCDDLPNHTARKCGIRGSAGFQSHLLHPRSTAQAALDLPTYLVYEFHSFLPDFNK